MTDLSNLKVGDKVCSKIIEGWGRRLVGLNTGTVDKVTATQIAALGKRWNIRTDREIGGDDRLYVWTQELQDEADEGKREYKAERLCGDAADTLGKLRGQDAVKMAAILPQELIEAANDRPH